MSNSTPLERVAKLLKLADGAATEGEAYAALNRAAALARRYNLSDVDIAKARRADGSSGVRLDVDPAKFERADLLTQNRMPDRWNRRIALIVAKMVGCGSVITSRGREHVLQIFGLPADVAVAVELYRYAMDRLKVQAKAWGREQRRSGKHWVQGGSPEVRTWKDGFVGGLAWAADRASADQGDEEAARIPVGDQFALVAVTDLMEAKSVAVTKYEQAEGMRSVRSRPVRYGGDAAFKAGARAGRSTNLSKDTIR